MGDFNIQCQDGDSTMRYGEIISEPAITLAIQFLRRPQDFSALPSPNEIR
jgi:hypothetical protein